MNSVDFCYWLQGFFELEETSDLTPRQVEIIRNHLQLVFLHDIDPKRNSETITPQDVLNQHHSLNNTQTLMRC